MLVPLLASGFGAAKNGSGAVSGQKVVSKAYLLLKRRMKWERGPLGWASGLLPSKGFCWEITCLITWCRAVDRTEETKVPRRRWLLCILVEEEL